MDGLVSQSEAARQLNVSRQAISQLVKAKKLPLIGKKIHMETAKAVLAQRLDPSRSKILRGDVDGSGDGNSDAVSGEGSKFSDYADAKARREYHEANLAEMRERKLAGELVDRAAVEASAYTIGRMSRDAVLAVPAKIAADLASTADHWELQQRLTAALRAALDDVARLGSADLDRDMAS